MKVNGRLREKFSTQLQTDVDQSLKKLKKLKVVVMWNLATVCETLRVCVME
jgi:hypothetical protein